MTAEERPEGRVNLGYVLAILLWGVVIILLVGFLFGGARVTIHPRGEDSGPPPWPVDIHSATTFLGERGGLYGWLVERRGEAPYTVYVTDDGHAVFGPLYAPDGTPLSERQIEEARNSVPSVPAPLPDGRDPEADRDGDDGGVGR